jgi:phosphopentomutase
MHRRFVILVADSAGCGALPDARAYGDEGSDTIGNTSRAVGGLTVPVMGRMGLGHLTAIAGVPPEPFPNGFHGRMAERSQGKDTITGHWEMMGIVLKEGLALFPNGFPPEIVEPFVKETGVPGILANRAVSGTAIIQELGEEHQRTGKPIVYTSADSVFQIAAHEETVPLEELYRWCAIARRQLDRHRVARVIARPFVGTPGHYVRTYHRKDFSIATPGKTVLERLVEHHVPFLGVGKIPDVFDRRGITDEVHTEGNTDGLAKTEALLEKVKDGLVFVNLVDFDMLYGHRNDPRGYARALEEMDRALPRLFEKLAPGDVLAITADHGCDPTTPSTDHSREYVPLLVHAPGRTGGKLGTRPSFADLGATVSEYFGIRPDVGTSFLAALR